MSRAVSDIDIFKVENEHLREKFAKGPEQERNHVAAHILLHEENGSPEKGKGFTDREVDLLNFISLDFKKLMIHTCKGRSDSNIGKVDFTIKLAGDIKCRDSGVGSYGGHIAREFKSPGPCNGHNYIKPHERMLSDKVSESQKEDLIGHIVALSHPSWERNFVADNFISKAKKTTTLHNHDLELAPIVDNSKFEAEVTNICSSAGGKGGTTLESLQNNNSNSVEVDSMGSMRQITAKAMELLTPKTKLVRRRIGASTRSASAAIKSTRSTERTGTESSNAMFEWVDERTDEERSHDEKKLRRRVKLWNRFMETLRSSSYDIYQKDLVELSYIQQPSDTLGDLMGYILILLGLSPTWLIARRSVFKSLDQFILFLQGVDPTNVPLRRLKKAVQWKDDSDAIYDLSLETAQRASSSLVVVMALAKWILCFDVVAKILISAEERRLQENKQEEKLKNSSKRKKATTSGSVKQEVFLAMTAEADKDMRAEFQRGKRIVKRAESKYRHLGIRISDPIAQEFLHVHDPTENHKEKKASKKEMVVGVMDTSVTSSEDALMMAGVPKLNLEHNKKGGKDVPWLMDTYSNQAFQQMIEASDLVASGSISSIEASPGFLLNEEQEDISYSAGKSLDVIKILGGGLNHARSRKKSAKKKSSENKQKNVTLKIQEEVKAEEKYISNSELIEVKETEEEWAVRRLKEREEENPENAEPNFFENINSDDELAAILAKESSDLAEAQEEEMNISKSVHKALLSKLSHAHSIASKAHHTSSSAENSPKKSRQNQTQRKEGQIHFIRIQIHDYALNRDGGDFQRYIVLKYKDGTEIGRTANMHCVGNDLLFNRFDITSCDINIYDLHDFRLILEAWNVNTETGDVLVASTITKVGDLYGLRLEQCREVELPTFILEDDDGDRVCRLCLWVNYDTHIFPDQVNSKNIKGIILEQDDEDDEEEEKKKEEQKEVEEDDDEEEEGYEDEFEEHEEAEPNQSQKSKKEETHENENGKESDKYIGKFDEKEEEKEEKEEYKYDEKEEEKEENYLHSMAGTIVNDALAKFEEKEEEKEEKEEENYLHSMAGNIVNDALEIATMDIQRSESKEQLLEDLKQMSPVYSEAAAYDHDDHDDYADEFED